jgi:hypothetical protein
MTALREREIVLEICPTSNLLTKALPDDDAVRETFRAFAEKPPAPVILLAEYRHRTFMKGQTAMMTETEATARLAKGLASGEYDNWTPDDELSPNLGDGRLGQAAALV